MNQTKNSALTALRNALAALIGYPPANVGGALRPRLGG